MSALANNNCFFIAGTDTNVGKTLVAASLAQTLIDRGKKVCAIKPVACGGNDIAILKKHSSDFGLAPSDINPFMFSEPISPHLAAKNEKIDLSVANIIAKTSKALNCGADYIIIEGTGGWYTPINDRETMADLAIAYKAPVILVVGIKLGCINHTILTYKCMNDAGIKIAGWVANIIDKKILYVEKNIAFLETRIGIPPLGIIPYIRGVNPKNTVPFLRNDRAF